MNGIKLLELYNNYMKKLGEKGVYNNQPYPDVLSHFPESQKLEDNYSLILAEYKNWLAHKIKAPTMVELGLYGGNESISKLPWNTFKKAENEVLQPLDWTSIFLKLNKKTVVKNEAYFPQTIELLNTLPNVVNVFFSRMGPHSSITPHYGYQKGFLRYHLGLVIPEGQRCYLEVDGVKYHWKVGEGVVFDDMFLHAAVNPTDEMRVILFIDFYRPLPFIRDLVNRGMITLFMQSKLVKNVLQGK
jgi:beta-hydroxylase